MQVDAHELDRNRERTFNINIKWSATVDVQELLDFVQCAPQCLHHGQENGHHTAKQSRQHSLPVAHASGTH